MPAAALAYVGLASAWGLSGVGSAAMRTKLSDLLPLPLELAAVATLALAARRAGRPRERRAWWLLAAAFGVYGLGDLLWAVTEVGFGRDPFPSAADLGYIAYYPIVAVSLLRFARRNPRERGQRLRGALDVATVVVGGFIVIYYVLLAPALRSSQPSELARILTIAYPLGDIVVLFAITTLLHRGSAGIARSTLLVLVASQVAFLVADLGFGALSSTDGYAPGSWVDSLWLLALALTLVAAIDHVSRQRVTPEADQPPIYSTGSRMPYAALAVGYGVVGWLAVREAAFHPVGGVLLAAAALTALVVARQVTALRENARLLAALHHLATTDPLTGLANRRRFYELAPEVLEEARSSGTPVALLMIDLDHLKAINDDLGHAAGDEAIERVAAACRRLAPRGSVVARYGGDEIIALLPDTDADSALLHAERLQHAVNEIGLAADPQRRLTLSVGVASVLGSGAVDALAGLADEALYEAKHAGRARVLLSS